MRRVPLWRVPGREHLGHRENPSQLGHDRGRGNRAGTRDRVQALLPVYERVLGRNHPEILRACRVLASWAEMASPGRRTPLLERSGSCWKA